MPIGGCKAVGKGRLSSELLVEVVVLVLHALGLDLRLQRPSHRVVIRGSIACVDDLVDEQAS